MSFSPGFGKLENKTIADWLNPTFSQLEVVLLLSDSN